MRSMQELALREYQVNAIDALKGAVRRGIKRVILQAPTGAGKTILAVRIILGAVEKGKRVLFLAHRGELIRQPARKLVEYGVPKELVALHMGGGKVLNGEAPIHVGTVQTLHRRDLDGFDIIISDECHRAVGPTHLKILDKMPNALRVGLTATPCRVDGRGLGVAFDEIIVVAKPSELVEQGAILDPLVYSVSEDQMPDLRGIGRKMGDFDKKGVRAAVSKAHLVDSIVENWQHRAQGLRTICFAVSRPHSRSIVDRFLAAGIAAAHIDGQTPKRERMEVLAKLERGELMVVSQCDLWVEGVDVPSVKCVILARPTQSLTVYLQSVGRSVRPWGGIRPVVLDHSGNVLYHGLPMQDREYSLEGGVTKTKTQLAKTCPSCYLLVGPSTPMCPECNYDFVAAAMSLAKSKKVVGITGLLEPVTPERILAEKRELWDKLLRECGEKGKDVAWALSKFIKRYRELPPEEWRREKIQFTDEAIAKLRMQLTQKMYVLGKTWDWVYKEFRNITGMEWNDARKRVSRGSSSEAWGQPEDSPVETARR